MDANNLLQQLKDIHHPAAVSWWPLAPGWYVLIAIAIASLIAGLLWVNKKRKQRAKFRYILAQLDTIKQQAQAKDPATISAISKLLRRMVLIHFPRHEVAGLSGEEWLSFLDATISTEQFSQGPGRLLLTVAYQQQWHEQTHDLINLVEEWMKKCLR